MARETVWLDQLSRTHRREITRLDQIPDEELWRTHERRRERLVSFARRRLHEQLVQRGAPQAEIEAANEELETLFSKSFDLSLIRMFPYTESFLSDEITDSQRDKLQKISPTHLFNTG